MLTAHLRLVPKNKTEWNYVSNSHTLMTRSVVTTGLGSPEMLVPVYRLHGVTSQQSTDNVQ
jgi:hypothetical protein